MTEPSVAEMIRRSRIERRRAHRIAALKRWAPKSTVLAATLAVAAWSVVAGPLHTKVMGASVATPQSTPPTTPLQTTSSAPTTSTTIGLVDAVYRHGDCVRWNQDQSSAGERLTTVVPCSSPHLIEIVGEVTVPAGNTAPFPSGPEWTTLGLQLCGPLMAPYLGYALDPAGRFGTGEIRPSPDGWSMGRRQMWCGITGRTPDGTVWSDQRFPPFAGSAKGQDQTFLHAVGTCLAWTLDGRMGDTVACPQPHAVEITGVAPLTTADLPQTAQAWSAAVGAACEQTTLQFAGGRLPSGVTSGWLSFEAASWAAGRRVVECTAARFDATGRITPETGSVRAP